MTDQDGRLAGSLADAMPRDPADTGVGRMQTHGLIGHGGGPAISFVADADTLHDVAELLQRGPGLAGGFGIEDSPASRDEVTSDLGR